MVPVEMEASQSTGVSAAAARRRSRAAAMSVATATGLVILKAIAGFLTNSLSLLASAVDSLTDIFASGVNYFAIRTASRPADEDHAYGHGKAEGLAGLFQGAVICASGLYLGSEAVKRLIKPEPVDAGSVAVGVMVVSIIASYVLVRYLRKVARETDSMALEADSLHYSTDVLANAGVLAVLVAVRLTGYPIFDTVVSLMISGYIIYAAFGVMKSAVDHLMDRALPDDVVARAREIALANPEVLGVHDVKTRSAGAHSFIELHLEVDGSRTLREAHDASVQVLRAIESSIPNSKVFVHTDPVDVEARIGAAST